MQVRVQCFSIEAAQLMSISYLRVICKRQWFGLNRENFPALAGSGQHTRFRGHSGVSFVALVFGHRRDAPDT